VSLPHEVHSFMRLTLTTVGGNRDPRRGRHRCIRPKVADGAAGGK